MSDETPVPGELAIGDHLAGYRYALAQFALEPGGGTLLVVDTGSGQVQAVKIGHPT